MSSFRYTPEELKLLHNIKMGVAELPSSKPTASKPTESKPTESKVLLNEVEQLKQDIKDDHKKYKDEINNYIKVIAQYKEYKVRADALLEKKTNKINELKAQLQYEINTKKELEEAMANKTPEKKSEEAASLYNIFFPPVKVTNDNTKTKEKAIVRHNSYISRLLISSDSGASQLIPKPNFIMSINFDDELISSKITQKYIDIYTKEYFDKVYYIGTTNLLSESNKEVSVTQSNEASIPMVNRWITEINSSLDRNTLLVIDLPLSIEQTKCLFSNIPATRSKNPLKNEFIKFVMQAITYKNTSIIFNVKQDIIKIEGLNEFVTHYIVGDRTQFPNIDDEWFFLNVKKHGTFVVYDKDPNISNIGTKKIILKNI